jgi:hypothetical protein
LPLRQWVCRYLAPAADQFHAVFLLVDLLAALPFLRSVCGPPPKTHGSIDISQAHRKQKK